MDYLIGTVIDNRYEILEKVGTGGMATVYKAKCKVLDRFVAIKILKDSLKNDADVVKKFNTESRAAARLSHPNIVQVYDVSETGKLDYIVMEYVDGITLKEYILEKGHLEAKEACNFAAQVGRALVCAHANGIIHRDIKPHNVLMASDGTVKVADFGIAQAATSETMVAGGGAMGSVHYLSPEQARGGFTNERSDIYSLGVVLYEMLTGKVPFDGANPVAVALAKLEKDPEDIRAKCQHYIPDSVCDIAMKAISKDQHSRYQSAAEMVSDLEKVLGVSQIKKSDEAGKFETKRLKDARDEYIMRKNTKHKKKNNQARTAGIIVGVLVLLAGLYMLGMGVFSSNQEYNVPDLTGMTIEEAEVTLEENNLRLGEVTYEESDEVDEGKIIRQKPGYNQFVKKNRKITVTVSSGMGDEMAKIPDVKDMTSGDAEKAIRKAGFECVIVEEYAENVEKDKVIRQEPKASEKAKKGTEVTIYVSGEEQLVRVPKLTGKLQAEAVKAITEAGLIIGEVTTGESEDKVGTVIGQHPIADTEVEPGSKVDIMISEGAGVPVPKKKTLTISIPKEGGENVQVRAVANGKEIYNKTHKRTEGIVDIVVQSTKDASVQVYMDGSLVADKVIYFD